MPKKTARRTTPPTPGDEYDALRQPREARLLAIDPGDVHVGCALFGNTGLGWRCDVAWETDPRSLPFYLDEALPALDWVVYERFVLEPDRAPKLAGSELKTAQLIGVVKHMVEWSPPMWPRVSPPEVVGQLNKAKRPMESWLKARNVPLVAVLTGAGGHAKDAELHGWYHLVHTLGEVPHPDLMP